VPSKEEAIVQKYSGKEPFTERAMHVNTGAEFKYGSNQGSKVIQNNDAPLKKGGSPDIKETNKIELKIKNPIETSRGRRDQDNSAIAITTVES
jgi:hypothetical protein